MRQVLNILICFLVFSLGTTAIAHVLERPDVRVSSHEARADEVALGHVSGDSDQVRFDSDKGYPHHHGGCHGDHVAAPVKITNNGSHPYLRLAAIFSIRLILPRSTADPALRPPQA